MQAKMNMWVKKMSTGKYKIFYTKKAVKDVDKIKRAGLANTAKELIELIRENPFANPPRFEKLVGDMQGAYSRRINYQHRLVYKVDKEKMQVLILRLWTHYE